MYKKKGVTNHSAQPFKCRGPKKTFGIKENCEKKRLQRKYRVRKTEKKQKENHARRSFRASGCSFREMNRKLYTIHENEH